MSFTSLAPFVTTHPEMSVDGGWRLPGIGSAVAAQKAAVDEVSTLIAAQFAAYAGRYQAITAQAVAMHEICVHTPGTSAASYAVTETANVVAAV